MSVTADEIRALVERYLAEYPDEADRLARLRKELAGSHEPVGHVTSSVVLIDPRWRVLHLCYRDRQRWLLPETHLRTADGSVAGAGLRALSERLGIDPDTVRAVPGFEVTPIDVDVHWRSADRATRRSGHWHYEIRHAFQVAGTPVITRDPAGHGEPTWLSLDAVPGFTLRLKLRLLHRSTAEDVG